MGAERLISVVMATRNRAELLKQALDSLARQTLARDLYEIVVVDDGSADDTAAVVRTQQQVLPLRCFRLPRSGTSAAKNLGVFAATAPLVLFFDDDDIADKDLLREHLAGHQDNPDAPVAVLGYTSWAPCLRPTELMAYVMSSGYLFNHARLNDGQELDYRYFWAGRISCKRAFLARRGIFDARLRDAAHEDVELGYRLSRFGLKIIFRRSALQYMNRPITYEEFCRRCEKQGAAQWAICRIHSEEIVRRHWQHWPVNDAEESWRNGAAGLDGKIARVQDLEKLLATTPASPQRPGFLRELHDLYRETFRLFIAKGALRAKQDERGHGSPDPNDALGTDRTPGVVAREHTSCA